MIGSNSSPMRIGLARRFAQISHQRESADRFFAFMAAALRFEDLF